MLYIEVMYHFNEQVDFKISSKLIQASKGLINSLRHGHTNTHTDGPNRINFKKPGVRQCVPGLKRIS